MIRKEGGGGMSSCSTSGVSASHTPSQPRYNGELHPLFNYTIRNVIWYQGESNTGQNALYTCRFVL